jgi:hypothetical protein
MASKLRKLCIAVGITAKGEVVGLYAGLDATAAKDAVRNAPADIVEAVGFRRPAPRWRKKAGQAASVDLEQGNESQEGEGEGEGEEPLQLPVETLEKVVSLEPIVSDAPEAEDAPGAQSPAPEEAPENRAPRSARAARAPRSARAARAPRSARK